MEESKELQGFYRIFRAVVYVSVLMEFFEYAIDPAMRGPLGRHTLRHSRTYQTVGHL